MKSLFKSLSSGIELRKLLRFENYLIFLPILVLTSTLSGAGVEDLGLTLIWLLANLVSLAVIYLIFLALHERVNRARKEIVLRVPGILGFGTVLGLAKSFLTFLVVWLLTDLYSFGWVLERTAQNLPLGTTTIGLFALVIAAKDSYLAERELLISHRIASLEDKDAVGSASARLRSSLVAKAAAEISQFRTRLENAQDIRGLESQANEMRSLAELTLRPLSHRIWAEQANKLNDFSLGQLARLGLGEKPFIPFLMPLILGPGLFNWASTHYGLSNGALMLLQISLVLVSLQYATNWFQTRGLFAGTIRLLAVSLIAALISTWILYPGGTYATEPEMTAMLISLLALFSVTALQIAIFSAGFRARADLRSELEAAYGKEGLDRIVEQSVSRFESRRLAQALHSEVQNRLLSTALKLEEGQLQSKSALEAELRAIEATVLELGQGTQRSIGPAEQEIKSACQAWRGFLKTKLQIEGNLAVWDDRARELGQAVNEALSNSKRHGHATEVQIRLLCNEDRLELEVRDNGKGSPEPAAGLGFALFNSLSPEGFSFTTGPEGSTLSVTIVK